MLDIAYDFFFKQKETTSSSRLPSNGTVFFFPSVWARRSGGRLRLPQCDWSVYPI